MISTAYYFGRTPTYTNIGPLWLWFVGFKQACKRRFHGRVLGPAPVDQEAVTPRWPGSRKVSTPTPAPRDAWHDSKAPDTLRTGHPWWHKGVLDTAGEEATESSRCPDYEPRREEADVPVDYDPDDWRDRSVAIVPSLHPEIPPPPSVPSIPSLGYYAVPQGPNYWAVLCLALTLALAWSVLGGGP